MWRVSRIYRRIPGFRPLKRAWRSRGFGIHSPFAFRFVTRVLREDGEYYAYRELRRIAHSGARFADLSLLFRIICCFSPSEVGVFGGLSVQARKAIAHGRFARKGCRYAYRRTHAADALCGR